MAVDLSGLMAGLDALGEAKESLARRMAVAAGVLVRDDAIARAPEGDPSDYQSVSRHSSNTAPGSLKNAMYLVFDKEASTKDKIVYHVSWNSEKAYWGAMVEFGVEMKFQVGFGSNGFFTFNTEEGLPNRRGGKSMPRKGGPLMIKARPFLGPALDANMGKMMARALEVGRVELPKLLSEKRK